MQLMKIEFQAQALFSNKFLILFSKYNKNL